MWAFLCHFKKHDFRQDFLNFWQVVSKFFLKVKFREKPYFDIIFFDSAKISEIFPVASCQYLSGVFLVNAFSRWPRPETIFPWSLPEHNLQRFTGSIQQEIFFLCFLVVSTRILGDIFQSFMVASTRTIFFWWRPPEKQKIIFLMYSSKWLLPEHRGRKLSDTDI